MRHALLLMVGLLGACGGPVDDVNDDDPGRLAIADGPVKLTAHWEYREGFSFDRQERLHWSTNADEQDEARVHRERADVDFGYGRYVVIAARESNACVFDERFNELEAIPDGDSNCEWTWGAYMNLIGDYPGPDHKGLGMLVRTRQGNIAKLLVLNDNMLDDVAMVEFEHAMVE